MQGGKGNGCLNLIKKFFVKVILVADSQIETLLKIDMGLYKVHQSIWYTTHDQGFAPPCGYHCVLEHSLQ